jgi:protein-S-isoprenylcysteine O-methyltransferase Ste14
MALATLGTVAATATLWAGRLPTGWFFVGPFAFRVADDRPGTRNLRRSLAQLIVFWTAFFVAVPLIVGAVERRLRLDWPALDQSWLRIVAAAVLTAASALGLWACVTMALVGEGTPLPSETARRLVARGPYRYVRNPMAVAGGLQTAAVGVLVHSWMVIALAAAGAVVWNQLIRPVEEADLAERLGAPYEEYRAAVRCWIPRRR